MIIAGKATNMAKKEKLRVRIDFDNTRLFDERITADQIDLTINKLKKKLG